jgi:hypothetical protein
VPPSTPMGRSSRAGTVSRANDGAVLAYGLVTGILAVSAGVVAAGRWERLTAPRPLVSIVTTLAVTVAATLFAAPILGWFVSGSAPAEPQDADDGCGDRDH